MMQHQPAAVSAAEPILEVQQVSRRFGTFQALTDISVNEVVRVTDSQKSGSWKILP